MPEKVIEINEFRKLKEKPKYDRFGKLIDAPAKSESPKRSDGIDIVIKKKENSDLPPAA